VRLHEACDGRAVPGTSVFHHKEAENMINRIGIAMRGVCCWGATCLFLLCGTAVNAAQADSAAAKDVKLDTLTMKVPASWRQVTPTSSLRLGHFELPAVEGDKEPADLGIFKFGAGGGIKENVERWINQFDPAERKSNVTKGKSPQGEYVFVDISGTFNKTIGPPIQGRTQKAPGYRMLGVILVAEDKGYYFLKLAGPHKTVTAAADALRTAFGGDAKMEQPFDPNK
jgi:gluconolactonase